LKNAAGRVDALFRTLIYGGLIVAAIGIALARNGEASGAGVIVACAVLVAAGVVLVWIRSRLRDS
jgi:sulfite exporter TauE/SafE